MLCTQCKKKEANVHFKGFINNKTIKMDLCEDCADKVGLTSGGFGFGLENPFGSAFNFPTTPSSLTGLFNLLSNWSQSPGLVVSQKICPQCRWSLGQIQKTGKLGCPECYSFFHEELKNILKTIQGEVVHKGKKPFEKSIPLKKTKSKKAKTKESKPALTLESLKSKLQKAIEKENYEEAALIRDQIKSYDH